MAVANEESQEDNFLHSGVGRGKTAYDREEKLAAEIQPGRQAEVALAEI